MGQRANELQVLDGRHQAVAASTARRDLFSYAAIRQVLQGPTLDRAGVAVALPAAGSQGQDLDSRCSERPRGSSWYRRELGSLVRSLNSSYRNEAKAVGRHGHVQGFKDMRDVFL